MITRARLKELLHYNPETGDFIRLVQTCAKVKVGDIAGCFNKRSGYWQIGIDDVDYLASRLAWFYMKGRWPRHEIDHKDTNRSNNRWLNLRDKTHAINLQNQRKAHRNNSTGFLGVTQDKRPGHKGFQANIGAEKKRHYLGTYPTPQEASTRYLDMKRKLHEGCTI